MFILCGLWGVGFSELLIDKTLSNTVFFLGLDGGIDKNEFYGIIGRGIRII